MLAHSNSCGDYRLLVLIGNPSKNVARAAGIWVRLFVFKMCGGRFEQKNLDVKYNKIQNCNVVATRTQRSNKNPDVTYNILQNCIGCDAYSSLE